MRNNILTKLKIVFIPTKENNYRPKFLEGRVLLYFLLILFVLKLTTIPLLIYFPKNVFFSAIVKTDLIKTLNQERGYLKLNPLKESPLLNKAAELKARDILKKGYFSHWSPDGISPWHWFKLTGYNYKVAGENLAIGFLNSDEVNQAWLNSPSHRANLLNPQYKEVGIAVLKGNYQGSETTIVVQLFGAPKNQATPPVREDLTKKETSDKKISQPKEKMGVLGEKEVSGENSSKEIKKEVLPVQSSSEEKASLEEKEILSSPSDNIKEEDISFKVISFLNSNYYKVVQWIIYGFLFLIILALIANIFIKMDVQHFDLIVKALGFIAILVLLIVIDKSLMTKFIPHNFYIH